ncbi:MAG TPA: hypothetical protein VHQ45_02460 [Gemmatimonadaceae bacterium]|nr:hypothetical protein [Gemmatimonadaceae bacterium]
MARLRRLTAIFMALLLTELVLVSSGYACTMPGMMGMGDLQPPSDAVVAHTIATPAPAADALGDCPDAMPAGPSSGKSPTPAQPCPIPWAPAGCHGTSCAPATLATAAQPTPDVAPRVTDRSSLSVLSPASVVRAPELPPPRA